MGGRGREEVDVPISATDKRNIATNILADRRGRRWRDDAGGGQLCGWLMADTLPLHRPDTTETSQVAIKPAEIY